MSDTYFFIFLNYFYDKIYTLGQKRSTDLREQLGIFNINDKLTQYKINWTEHIQRMDDNRLRKKKIKLQT